MPWFDSMKLISCIYGKIEHFILNKMMYIHNWAACYLDWWCKWNASNVHKTKTYNILYRFRFSENEEKEGKKHSANYHRLPFSENEANMLVRKHMRNTLISFLIHCSCKSKISLFMVLVHQSDQQNEDVVDWFWAKKRCTGGEKKTTFEKNNTGNVRKSLLFLQIQKIEIFLIK